MHTHMKTISHLLFLFAVSYSWFQTDVQPLDVIVSYILCVCVILTLFSLVIIKHTPKDRHWNKAKDKKAEG